jgi:hypothetical protein
MNFFARLSLGMAATLLCNLSFAQQPGLGQLYPAAPPEGASFVRVLNPSLDPVKISLGGKDEIEPLSAGIKIGTNYRTIGPGQAVRVSVNGAPILAPIKVEPNSFATLILKKQGDQYAVAVVHDSTQGQNALKATLRFYNLVQGCVATVSAARTIKIFENVPAWETRHRFINPVGAQLTAACGQSESSPLQLPALQPGGRYSIFVTGESSKPVLSGRVDGVE